jgi:hypothetical protein
MPTPLSATVASTESPSTTADIASAASRGHRLDRVQREIGEDFPKFRGIAADAGVLRRFDGHLDADAAAKRVPSQRVRVNSTTS